MCKYIYYFQSCSSDGKILKIFISNCSSGNYQAEVGLFDFSDMTLYEQCANYKHKYLMVMSNESVSQKNAVIRAWKQKFPKDSLPQLENEGNELIKYIFFIILYKNNFIDVMVVIEFQRSKVMNI